MKIVIVEDESLIGARIKRFISELMHDITTQITLLTTLESAQSHMAQNPVDILFLDLNLNGKDGFEILKNILAESFQTIIISANTERAIEAFEYGVLDFIPKPFSKERIAEALSRLEVKKSKTLHPIKYLSIRKKMRISLVDINQIAFIKGAGNYSEIHQIDGSKDLHDKSLNSIYLLLPSHFERLHKSYIVNVKNIEEITNDFKIHLVNDTIIPISRSEFKRIKSL